MVNFPRLQTLTKPMNRKAYTVLSLVVLFGLAAIALVPAPSTAAESTPAAQPKPLTQPLTNPAALPPSFLPTITIQDLMNDTINPNVRALWNAVSYTVTEQGATDTKPTSEADWIALREKADALLKGAATLMLPALKITSDAAVKTPAYQYTPTEIEQLRRENADIWREYVQRLQATTQALIKDIENRDVEAYTEHGSPINQACEGCHADFWYRPSPRRGR